MKKALLVVDRGSREPEVAEELEEICTRAKIRGGYDFTFHCFLEVVPPFIDEGVSRCLDSGADEITVVPYFLYPGMKLKESVKRAARLVKERNLKMAIAKPLSYHSMMGDLVRERIAEIKSANNLSYPDMDCDVLVVGHGSSDKNAHDAFIHVVDEIKPGYRNVHHCFLELDSPDIEAGVANALAFSPKVILIVPFFLHRGAHVKKDVPSEISVALQKHNFKAAYMSRHLGVDDRLVDMILERAKEVEKRAGC